MSGLSVRQAIEVKIGDKYARADALYLGETANVTYVPPVGARVTLPNLQGGMWHAVESIRIVETKAQSIVVGYREG